MDIILMKLIIVNRLILMTFSRSWVQRSKSHNIYYAFFSRMQIDRLLAVEAM